MRRGHLIVVCILSLTLGSGEVIHGDSPPHVRGGHGERIRDPYLPPPPQPPSGAPPGNVVFGPYVSMQVNTDAFGRNILGDAANEPSIAIDPTNPDIIVIGWRQFDNVASDFRQAGWAYSHDAGLTWTFPGVLQPGVFGSDPVLGAGADGTIFYCSLRLPNFSCYVFRSSDGGLSWKDPTYAYGGDKPWMVVDATPGIGNGNIYLSWPLWTTPPEMTRSTNGGLSFIEPILLESVNGSMAIDVTGRLYTVGVDHKVFVSVNAKDPGKLPSFEQLGTIDPGGHMVFFAGPNPMGALGQLWIDADPRNQYGDYLYVLNSVNSHDEDPLDIMCARSVDGGYTWPAPVRVNDDAQTDEAWQWFGTMSVAPNGRIDAIWNDTRHTLVENISELHYAYSSDGGATWSANVQLGPTWDSHVGWPSQNHKIGDYYHMRSDDTGANLAYAATYTGEQDIYFLRIGFPDVDNDRHISLVDYATLQECFSGSDGNGTRPCQPTDVDRDNDVDLVDAVGMVNVFGGP